MKKLRVVDKSEVEAKVEVELKENPDGTVLNNEETEEITYVESPENEISLDEKENNTIKLELSVCLVTLQISLLLENKIDLLMQRKKTV